MTRATQRHSPEYARTVRGSGPGLLLAHGAGGSVAGNVGPIMDELAARWRVVGIDMPGSGDTPVSHIALSVDLVREQFLTAADAEGLDRFAIAGWSLGAAV
jgi:3-oxoadipate enol-lactonase